MEEKSDTNYLKHETNKYMYDFLQFQRIASFGDSILNGINYNKWSCLKTKKSINSKTRPWPKVDKEKKSNTFKNINVLYDNREFTLNAFK